MHDDSGHTKMTSVFPGFDVGGSASIGGTGLRRMLCREGRGEPPGVGARVFLLYVGWLSSGELFDRWDSRDAPFAFRIGAGEVVRGIDLAVATMRTGEVSVVFVPSGLAYGEAGKPPGIRPHADLVFKIELLAISPPVHRGTVLIKNPIAAVARSGEILCCKADGVFVPLHGPNAMLVAKIVTEPKPVGVLMAECGLAETKAEESYELLGLLVDMGVLSTIGSWPAKPRLKDQLG